jgi:Coenzyme PQQ synthesis protein D (PqqD)
MTLALRRVMSVDRVRISPLVKGSTTDDGLVLLDVRGGLVLASNVVGARIWQLIAEQRGTSEIADCIAAEFTVDRDRATRDVAAFVAALCARGVVSQEDPC